MFQSSVVVDLPLRQARPKSTAPEGRPRFQSLLSWICLSDPLPPWGPRECGPFSGSVSILVVVDLPLRHRGVSDEPDLDDPVSILGYPVVDLPLRPLTLGIEPSASNQFQSLLSWICLFDGPKGRAIEQHPQHHVSILVVVDLPLRRFPSARQRSSASRRCFNPCCRGSAFFDTARWIRVARILRRFNPCCRGSASSTRSCCRRASAGASQFQSLLSWICLFDSVSMAVSITSLHGGFNPCCRGICLFDSRRPRRTGRSSGGFQSLLSWICLFDIRHRRRHPERQHCFNPCCGGSPSSTLLERGRAHRVGDPVSILVVVDLPLRPDRADRSHGQTHVSILVVVDLPLRQARSDRRRTGGHQVSILVVVDLPLRPRPPPASPPLRSCFNPCCRGSASSTCSRSKASKGQPPVERQSDRASPGRLNWDAPGSQPTSPGGLSVDHRPTSPLVASARRPSHLHPPTRDGGGEPPSAGSSPGRSR